ncbi:uncharacterized protein FOMMEDRAFT_154122 [Fomitiporia mediterranea MF3/22]|uniref:uncharacterized protein n=1 Tax=Fomitiporia mediterranea (strain MF3/22) TaxID=694068 RepID=UPI0004407A12|nr:uncharacterized protein FOMMEDRAFT_154122 [Fomitiporia mediterranea MF3/22]EJD04971.1 hypothetical protein FOMMEDRAFT_154122 [Fomitiporia mediterranea MF3/22]
MPLMYMKENQGEAEAEEKQTPADAVKLNEAPSKLQRPRINKACTLRQIEAPPVSQNILAQFFGPMLQNVVKGSSSESEHEDEEDEEDEEEYSIASQSEEETPSSNAGRRHKSISANAGAASAADSDSRASVSKPLTKQAVDDEDSVTEPDSQAEDGLDSSFSSLKESGNGNQPQELIASTGSDTESDDDFELDDPFLLEPRPSFSRDSSQVLAPYVLDAEKDIKIPAHINVFLREYQREGVQFLYDRYKEGRGGVLGDDMGLGKTIQVISFLTAIMDKYNDRRDVHRRRKHVSRLQDGQEWREHRRLPPANATWPTCLIIAPSSVTHNWQREFGTWGYFEIGMYNGPPEQRREALRDFTLGRLDVLIASFDTARGDIDLLSYLPWSVIFVDEAHKLKNPASKITLAFNQFTCEARFGLTGTAIQNAYDEMWTLLDWSNRGRLGSLKDWRAAVSRPLAVGQSASASEAERTVAKAVAHILVTKLLPNFFLRRTKDLIRNQLPQKIDEVVFCPLTPQQITVYKRILAHREKRMKANSTSPLPDTVPCDCGSGLPRGKCCHVMESVHFFTYLTILLKISNHLALILPSPNDTEEQTKRNREISRIAFQSDTIPKYGPAILLPQFCGKWDVLNLLLKEWQKDRTNKVLIFTKSVKLLDMLDYHLNSNSYSFCRLDGSTKQNERMPLIDKFNNDPEIFIFLISTLAGGTGLNLTSANKVVIFDPNWNPAHDLQAMDRAYRFGQTRDVYVYRLLGAGSIEELIYARQVYKQQMMKIGYEASHQTRYFEGVQGDTKRRGELFGADNLFRLHENTLATKMAIERAHLAEFDWALAHMEGNKKGKARASLGDSKEALEAEARNQGHEDADLRGLATLLFDDGVPAEERGERINEIQRILAAGSIKYTHQNEDLLRPSRVEEVSLAESLKKLRKRKAAEDSSRERGSSSQQRRQSTSRRRGNHNSPSPPVPEWPPRRSHHQQPLSPRSKYVLALYLFSSGVKLRSRQKALIETGLIGSAKELPAFATKFGAMTSEEQSAVLEKLDRHARGRGK